MPILTTSWTPDLDTAMDLDYSLVGGVMVKFDIANFGGSEWLTGTQGGKDDVAKVCVLARMVQ